MVKTYSMWVESTKEGKFKFCQRYVNPLKSTINHKVVNKVTVTLSKDTPQSRKKATEILLKKIEDKLDDEHKGTDITLQELTDKYQQYLKDLDRPWSTRKRALSNFKFINEYFAGAIAKNVTTSMINNYLEYCLYKRKRKLSNSSTRLRKVFLSNAYRYGIDHGLININPVVGVKVRWKDESKKERERVENKYLTDEELRAILGYVKYIANRPDYYYLFKFTASTGMRIDEATGILKKNIIKKNGITYAKVEGTQEYRYGELYKKEKQTTRNVKSDHTKTKSSYRMVQLNKSACKIVNNLMPFRKDNDHLFINSYFKNVWNVYTILSYLKTIDRKLGIAKQPTTHFFRHTYISKMVELGTPLNVIMAQVGQKNSSITRDIYTHVTEREMKLLHYNLSQYDADIDI